MTVNTGTMADPSLAVRNAWRPLSTGPPVLDRDEQWPAHHVVGRRHVVVCRAVSTVQANYAVTQPRETTRRNIVGTLAALTCITVLTAVMLPLRMHLSTATTALVLVVPVVVGVASGGYLAGVMSVLAGFVVYDFFFIPSYLTLYVGAPNRVALVVYAAVMLPVARVVGGMNLARAQARERGLQIRRLFELSTLLVEDRPLPDLLSLIVTTLADVLNAHQVALLLPSGEHLEVPACPGAPMSAEDWRKLQPTPGQVTGLDTVTTETGKKRKPGDPAQPGTGGKRQASRAAHHQWSRHHRPAA